MRHDTTSTNLESDIFILPATPGGFMRWLNYTLSKIKTEAGLLASSWLDKPETVYTAATLNIARVDQEQSPITLTLLLEISIVPIETEQTLVELESVRGSYSDPAYMAIVNRIERTWPQTRKERATNFEQKKHLQPVDLRSYIDQKNLDITTEQLHRKYLTLQTSGRTIRRTVPNRGGHPALECNVWAHRELLKRPGDRNEIFEQWGVKYKEEVGEEVANLRNLRDTFNAAMRYWSGKLAS